METIDEILTAFRDKQSDHELLRQRMEADFVDLYALKPYQPDGARRPLTQVWFQEDQGQVASSFAPK